MSENIPNIPGAPFGALPPKKETGKVQPKKETVRISLPPKPTAAPTIKLPTLPPGGPSAAPGGAKPAPMFSGSGTPTAGAPKPGISQRPATATPSPTAAAVPAARRPAAPAPARAASGLDSVLAIGAAVAGIIALVSSLGLWLGWFV